MRAALTQTVASHSNSLRVFIALILKGDYTVTSAQSSLWDGEQIQIIKCAGLPNKWTWSNGMFEFADTEPKVSIASVDELL